jgi:hypothetical protein
MVRNKLSSNSNFYLDYTNIPSTRLLSSSPSFKNYLKTTLHDLTPGSIYPPLQVRQRQTAWAKKYLYTQPSSFVNGGAGLFSHIDLPENTVLGCYGGTINTQFVASDYSLLLSSTKPFYQLYVDAQDHLQTFGYLGLINEYIWTLAVYDPHVVQNCKFTTDGTGMVYTTKDIPAGTELTLYLGDQYNWDSLIYQLLLQLHSMFNIPKPSLTEYLTAKHSSSPSPLSSAIATITTDTTSDFHYRRLNRPRLHVAKFQQLAKIQVSSSLPSDYADWYKPPHSSILRYCDHIQSQLLPSHLDISVWKTLTMPLSHS